TIDRETLRYLSDINPFFLLIALVLHVASWFIWALRISILCRFAKPDCKVSFIDSISVVITNLFLAAVTPSMAGGEPVRIHMLSKKGLGTGRSTAVVISERIFDAIFIIVLLPFAVMVIAFQGGIVSNNVIRYGLLTGLILFGLGIVVFVYSLVKPDKIKRFILTLNKKFSSISKGKIDTENLIKKIEGFLREFQVGSKFIFSMKNSRGVAATFVLTAIYWLSEFLVASFVLLGLGQNPIWIKSIAAQILLLVIIMIPLTPGSSGLAEGAGSIIYNSLIGSSILGIFIALWRFITFHVNIIVGGVFQYKLAKSLLR
ncbi:MAG TPA: flippase-like domain-containing protein, partial [Thermoplasmatales archaeon]|nr:flippase-like domain-containing protein [Thermoplasmatales archaeon]